MESLLEFLEMSPGGQGHAPGFGFLQTPAPGDLTLGGVLAINGHGSAIPNPLDPLHLSYGSLSHQILEFTAIVGEQRDDGSVLYAAKTFTRDSAGNAAFLVHLGRALLVEVVLQVVDNYNLRCESRMDIDAKKLFCAPPSSGVAPRSFAEFVEKSGRAEAIWFPFTDDPWLKVWTRTPTKPAGASAVDAPYNYAFSDNLPEWVSKIFGFITSNFGFKTPGLTRPIGDITEFILGLGADDLWGPSKNTLLYVRSDTLRVTANGYAVQMPRSDLQRAVFEFAQHFDAKLRTYKKQGLYPINGPVEIRVTGLDTPCAGGPAAASPLLSSLTFDATARERGYDIALWIDVLTLPGTPHSKRFYAELDEWIFENYASYARPLPEWSKGYAYDGDAGPWRNEARLEAIRAAYGPAWKEHVGTLQRADPANLFTNAFLDRLFSPGALSG
jgi:FAD/FMN-containing dehydrogenase